MVISLGKSINSTSQQSNGSVDRFLSGTFELQQDESSSSSNVTRIVDIDRQSLIDITRP
jgi:hypothetical protein